MKSCTVCGAEWDDGTKFCPNDGTTLRSAEGPGLVGSIIGGNYHIEKKLGEGGMGAVYLGEHVKMGRKSAIKVMTQAMANNPEAIARFNREATNASRINHPNVCAIYDFGETPDGTIFLAMEFIEGEALGDRLAAAGGLFPLDRAADILEQTADALQSAHDLGIVHRDLKPDNIMIAKSRGKDLVKVVDFGIAKAMGGEEGQEVTKTGLVIGTPEYMSPEQLSGDVLDGRSDIYSLALVFFRMITGTLPFPAESAQETMIKRLTHDPLTLEQALPGGNFPPGLQAVINHALRRMPRDRFENATELSAGVRTAIARALASDSQRPSVDTEGATQLMDKGQVTPELPPTSVTPVPATGPTPATPAPIPSPRSPWKKTPVVPIAAVVLVVAAAGTTGVVMIGGGENGDSGPPLGPNGSSEVLANVDGGESGTRTTPITTQTGGSNQADPPVHVDPDISNRDIDSTSPGPTTAGTTLDIAQVHRDLGRIMDEILAGNSNATLRQEAETIYNDQAVPDSMRASAAFAVASAYADELRNTDACDWALRAHRTYPGTQYANLISLIDRQLRSANQNSAGCTG